MRSCDRTAEADKGGACWVLLGPTASGKSELSIDLARRFSLEVVSVDSMQVYRDMDVGTAKPSPEARGMVPHHMIDVVEPEEHFSVSRFRRMALEAMRGIPTRGKQPLLVCGTPLYLKALLWGLFPGPGADPRIRQRLRREAEMHGVAHLHTRLAELDPRAAARIGPNDLKRIERALEVYELTGRPISEQQAQFDSLPQIPYCAVGLRHQRRALYERIERRVDAMMAAGLLEEVRRLKDRLGLQARQAVGYKELLAWLDGRMSLEESVDRIKRNTRRLAKHQLTWFRHFPDVQWIDASDQRRQGALAEKCARAFYSLEQSPALGYD